MIQDKQVMKNIWKFMEHGFVIVGLPVMCVVGYILISDTVFFWQHGVEKQAIVKHIVKERHGARSTSYEYVFEIEGRKMSRIFTQRLPLGEPVGVLVSPDDSQDFILGSKDHSLFELFASNVGGKFIAGFILLVYLFIIGFMLTTMMRWMKNRKT